MPKGGKRANAGRKPGSAWASQRPPAVRTAARAKVREIIRHGDDPLSILIGIARDEAVELPLRVQAATAAAPYCYPKLSAAVVAEVSDKTSPADTSALMERLTARLDRIDAHSPVRRIVDVQLAEEAR